DILLTYIYPRTAEVDYRVTSVQEGCEMKTVKLGSTGPEVSRLGLGTMGMSEFYGPRDDVRSIETIHRAMDAGMNFFDTADMYGPFHNEELVGAAIKGHRDRVVIATKFGIVRGPKGEFGGVNNRPEYIRQSVEGSLRRLDIDTIDLYYMHRRVSDVPVEESVGAMADLVEEGKVRYLGLSEVSPATLKKANDVHPIAAVQSEYSLWSTDIEAEVIPALKRTGASLVAYSPLGRGFLAGAYRREEDIPEGDWRRTNPRFQGESFTRNMAIVEAVRKIADGRSATPGQIALAWLLAKGEDVVPIFGTTRPDHLLESIRAVDIQLSVEDIEILDGLTTLVAGPRYLEEGMSRLFG
ncbi:MAG: aldo/keto reductase, partial [Bacteroidota bacterium]